MSGAKKRLLQAKRDGRSRVQKDNDTRKKSEIERARNAGQGEEEKEGGAPDVFQDPQPDEREARGAVPEPPGVDAALFVLGLLLVVVGGLPDRDCNHLGMIGAMMMWLR